MASETIDWPALYYASRDPDLHEAGEACREALDRVGAAAIEWASREDGRSKDSWRAILDMRAIALRDAKERLDTIGARLWAERGGSDGE